MSDPQSPINPAQNIAGGVAAAATYNSSRDALKEVGTAFDYWSGQVSSTSLQMCYALIAANWLIFGSIGKILSYKSAAWSLITVLATIAFNLVSSYALAEWLRCRFGHAESDRKQWEKEYQEEKHKPSVWPYTKNIERASITIRAVRAFLPLIGGGLLIVAAIMQQKHP
jgi:hypothetical protein